MLKYYRQGMRGASNRIQAGQVVYLQDVRPMGRCGRVVRVNPFVVESFDTRTYAAARRGEDGKWTDTRMARGHLVNLRSLRDGRSVKVSDWIVEASAELAA